MIDRKKSVDFSIKSAWLTVAKMYNALGADYDITHSNGFVLLNIDAENGTPATKIAPLMGMESRSLTRMLKSLEEEGLIEKGSDGIDKRRVIIKLTELGKVKREISRRTVKAFHNEIVAAVGEKKISAFFDVVEAVCKIAESQEWIGKIDVVGLENQLVIKN